MRSPAPFPRRSSPRARLLAWCGALVAGGSLLARAALAAPLATEPRSDGVPEGARSVLFPAGLLEESPRLFTNKLDDPSSPSLGLLRAFHDASVERPGVAGAYLASPWGRWGNRPWWNLGWNLSGAPNAAEPDLALSDSSPVEDAEPAVESLPPDWFATEASLSVDAQPLDWLRHLIPGFTSPFTAYTGPSLRSDGYDTIWAPPPKPIPWWKCSRRPVAFVRYGGESDTFALLRCDGSVAPEALDRLSLIARPVDVERPGALLPDEPEPESWAVGEWVPHVRLVNPRLAWLLQRIAEAFPRRPIYVYSGYRPPKAGARREGGHHSQHADGRAMDVSVYNVPNEALFRLCRTLDDVGCGYYPNSKFVHVDVRRPATGHAFWIDASAPSEPSRYVDSWPGVVESGALVWGGAH